MGLQGHLDLQIKCQDIILLDVWKRREGHHHLKGTHIPEDIPKLGNLIHPI